MFDRLIKSSWLIPVLAALVPLSLLLLGWLLNAFGLNGLIVRPVFWLFFVAAPYIGLQTVTILKVQNNLRRSSLRQWNILCAAVFACLDMVAPIWLAVIYVIILKPQS